MEATDRMGSQRSVWGTSPFKFFRRATGDRDVAIKVLYCGMCHSGLHECKNELGRSVYPLVPWHEVVGVVTEVGSQVINILPGDKVGVGCMIGSCRSCYKCKLSLENYCSARIGTANFPDANGNTTYGGYSDYIVADEHFVVRIPDTIPLQRRRPLIVRLHHRSQPVEILRPGQARNARRSGGAGKEEAMESLGADFFLESNDEEQLKVWR